MPERSGNPMEPKYRDARADFWKEHFAAAVPYEEYLRRSDPQKAERWATLARTIPPLTKEQKDRLSGFGRKLNILVYSGVWCGDCVRQGPMIEMIARACGDAVQARFIERDASGALQEEVRILGALRVPIAVFLSEDFFEIARLGDRTLSVYRAKARRDIGPACYAGLLPPPANELAAEVEEWVAAFERILLMLRLSPMLRERYGD